MKWIEALKDLEKKATPEPFFMKDYLPTKMEDYEFVQSARSSIPKLIASLEISLKALKEIGELKRPFDKFPDEPTSYKTARNAVSEIERLAEDTK